MKIFEGISSFQKINNPILTLGMFDGVHLGHQALIGRLNEIAQSCDGESVLLTFDPHPRTVLGNDSSDLQLITTLSEKILLLEKAGLQNLILQPFTKAFSELCSTDFVKELLVDEICMHTIVIGYDHHFGKNREGDFEQLLDLSKKYHFEVNELSEIKSDKAQISSTKIREALWNGELSFANQALGRNYDLTGQVVHGDKLGRTLGFPTANLKLEPYKLIPANGVYVVKVQFENQTFKGLLSIGTRPTVTNSNEKRVEVYILDFDGNVYDKNLTVELLHFIRPDMKFNSLDELVYQMNLDKEFAINYDLN